MQRDSITKLSAMLSHNLRARGGYPLIGWQVARWPQSDVTALHCAALRHCSVCLRCCGCTALCCGGPLHRAPVA